jgi:hypothetical protein
MPANLTVPARLAELRPEFCAFLLRAYLKAHSTVTLDHLARQLGCAPARLSDLWLCGRPGARWDADVTRIAEYVGCDRAALAQLLQQALLLS